MYWLGTQEIIGSRVIPCRTVATGCEGLRGSERLLSVANPPDLVIISNRCEAGSALQRLVPDYKGPGIMGGKAGSETW